MTTPSLPVSMWVESGSGASTTVRASGPVSSEIWTARIDRTLLQRAAHRVRPWPPPTALTTSSSSAPPGSPARSPPSTWPRTRARRRAGRWPGATRPSSTSSPTRLGGDPETLKADVTDPASLRRVAESARVVITTVGPYIRYGEPLVAACAEAGTDYVDLTGEPEFVDRMYLAHHERATPDRRAAGARVRLRLDPPRPRRAVHRRAAARGRADRRQGLRVGAAAPRRAARSTRP